MQSWLLSNRLSMRDLNNRFIYFIIYVHRCFVSVFVCEPHACSIHEGQKRAIEPQEMGLQKVVKHQVGAGNLENLT